MAHAEFQTPVGEIAPYIARQTEVPTGTDAGVLTVLLRAPPNANVQLVQLGGYGNWGSAIVPLFWLVPPDGSLDLPTGTPNTYPMGVVTVPLEGTGIADANGYIGQDRGFRGPLWIPAGWALAVAPSGTTSGSAGVFSAVGILSTSPTWGG
ncbi:MAG TPA: hypothetical protein EYN66_11130 [Myxococcales bacterium]|nr:hypothetical protein [Myxococcales bacterium]